MPGLTHYGRSMNLSCGGVAVTLAYSFNIANGTRVDIVLQPKGLGATENRSISFKAEVVWRKANLVGLKIQDMDQITSIRYKHLLYEAQDKKGPVPPAPPAPPPAFPTRKR